jgi:hypothetical protein
MRPPTTSLSLAAFRALHRVHWKVLLIGLPLMQCTSHPECHKTAVCVSEPLRIIDFVHQQQGYIRDAAGDGDRNCSQSSASTLVSRIPPRVANMVPVIPKRGKSNPPTSRPSNLACRARFRSSTQVSYIVTSFICCGAMIGPARLRGTAWRRKSSQW